MEDEPIRLCCPHCKGSENIRTNDRVYVSTWIRGWEIGDDGERTPVFADRQEVWWDTTEPTHELMPYECGDCMVSFDDEALVPEEKD